jgi:hypothetical protein
VGLEVFLRRKKFLLAMRCLLQLKALGLDEAKVKEYGGRLKKTMAEAGKDLPDKVKEIVLSEGGDLVR